MQTFLVSVGHSDAAPPTSALGLDPDPVVHGRSKRSRGSRHLAEVADTRRPPLPRHIRRGIERRQRSHRAHVYSRDKASGVR